MEFKLLPACLIFAGSYLPLSIILLFQNIEEKYIKSDFCIKINDNCEIPKLESPILSISFFLICLFSYVVLRWHFFKKIRKTSVITVNSSKPIPNDLINYVFPYVVAFMNLDFTDERKTIGFFIFFIWMFYITYKSGQILMNPLILSFGWKLYEASITYENEKIQAKMLSKETLKDNAIHQSCLIQGIYILHANN